MKKRIVISVMIICMMFLAIGCSDKKSDEVEKLESKLSEKVESLAESEFGVEFKTEDFDCNIGIKNDKNEFYELDEVKDVKEVYYTGFKKGKPETILNFMMIYDVQEDKVVKFGIEFLEDEEMRFMK